MEDRKKYDEKYRQNHPGRVKKSYKKYYRKNVVEERSRSLLKMQKYKKEHPEKVKAWFKKYYFTTKGIFNYYKKNAKKRGLKISLSFDEFSVLVNGLCYYCGEAARGIDRLNNKKGYTKNNSVSCCKVCNYMKLKMPVEEFIKKCKQISNHQP